MHEANEMLADIDAEALLLEEEQEARQTAKKKAKRNERSRPADFEGWFEVRSMHLNKVSRDALSAMVKLAEEIGESTAEFSPSGRDFLISLLGCWEQCLVLPSSLCVVF